MKTITISLSSIENQLYEYNSRLSLIEGCLCNMFDVASTPSSSFSTSPTVLANEQFSTQTDTSLPTGDVLIIPDEIQTPPSKQTPATTSISPLVLHLPQETSKKVKKIKAKTRGQYVRGCMDALFTPSEMATSNLGGKRKKEKLDEARVHLVKRKLKLLTLLDFSLCK